MQRVGLERTDTAECTRSSWQKTGHQDILTSSINEHGAVLCGNVKYGKIFIYSGQKAENKSNEPSQYIDIGRYTPILDSKGRYRSIQCDKQHMKSGVNAMKG
jgi:hypothetical protein